MFDSQFRLSPDLLNNGTTTDESSSNNTWPQMSLDRLFEHHDITPAKPISINDTGNNDFWSSSAQFKEFFNNYHQQYQQQNQPIDISSFLSSSPQQQQLQPTPPKPLQQKQQHQQQFTLPLVDNHIFEPQQDAQPLYFNPYLTDNNSLSLRQDSFIQQDRFRQPINYQQQQQQQQHHHNHHPFASHSQAPPLLQIPNEEYYHHQPTMTPAPPRFKQHQHPAYVACLNHGINYNGVSGPPILLPPSF